MISKTKSIIIIAIIVILFVIVGIYLVYFYKTDETTIELNVFKNMTSNVSCADITNELFVIDNQMVFWAVEGNCPDASYTYTLYGRSPDEMDSLMYAFIDSSACTSKMSPIIVANFGTANKDLTKRSIFGSINKNRPISRILNKFGAINE